MDGPLSCIHNRYRNWLISISRVPIGEIGLMSIFYYNISASAYAALSDLAQFGFVALILGTIVMLPSFLEKKDK